MQSTETQATVPAQRIQTTLQADGTLTLNSLPFVAGQAVEVIVLPQAAAVPSVRRYPLRGTPVHYDRPFDPVAEDDWGALK